VTLDKLRAVADVAKWQWYCAANVLQVQRLRRSVVVGVRQDAASSANHRL